MFPFDFGTHSTYKPRCKVIGNIVNIFELQEEFDKVAEMLERYILLVLIFVLLCL